jgi:hypothetical protein
MFEIGLWMLFIGALLVFLFIVFGSILALIYSFKDKEWHYSIVFVIILLIMFGLSLCLLGSIYK